MFIKKAVFTLSIACCSAASWSLDLSQAYQAALAQDATIRAARATAAAGRETLPQARAQLLPNISLSVARYRNQLSSTQPDFLGRQVTTDSNYGSRNDSLVLRQPIYRKYQFARYEQAKAEVDNVNAVLEIETQNVAVRVGNAYFEALLAHDQLALVMSQKKNYATQLDAARKTFAAGSGTRTDIDEAQARVDLSVAQELEARQLVEFTRRLLEVLVNQPLDELAKLDASRLELLPPEPANVVFWVERAELASPEIRALKARIETARQEVEMAKSGHYPTLDAIAQLTRSGSENVLNTGSSSYNRSIGLQLTIPIYAGGGVESNIRQALASKERAEEQLEVGRRDLGVRVHKEFRAMTEGVLRVRALEQAVRSADQVVISSSKSFEAGVRTRLDVLNAERDQISALRDLAQARYMYVVSQLRLKALVQEADDQSIAVINRWLTTP